MAKAVTSSSVRFGWYRMPPLNGPRASQCWTRQPLKTPMVQLSIFMVTETVIVRLGFSSMASRPGSRLSFSAAIFSCCCAVVNAECS